MKPQKTIFPLLVLLVIGLPLFLNTLSDNEFTFNKTFLFRLVILIAVAISLFYLPQFITEFKVAFKKFKPYLIMLAFYFGALVLATVFSISPFVSFFGSTRQQGLMQFLFYLIFFFVVLMVVKKQSIIILLYFIISTSFLVSFMGILEYFGIRLFPYPVYDFGIASTLGHPSFLGAYLVMILPIIIFLSWSISGRFWKIVLGLVALFQFTALFLTKTRAAWLAFFISFLFAFILYLIKNKKTVLLAILFILLLGSSIFVLNSGYLNNLNVFESGSGALRVIWWEDALKAIQKRPVLGYGLETQEEVLMPYFSSAQELTGRVDRAHNEILDDLLTTGILGTALFFILIILVFKEGINCFLRSKDKKQSLIIIALLTSLLAYFIQGMFSFSVTVLYVYFWLLVALVIILVREEGEDKGGINKEGIVNKS